MKVAFLVVCWFSFQQAIFGIEGPWSEYEQKCPESEGWLYPNMVLSRGTFLTIPGISIAPLCQLLCAEIPDCEFFTQEADYTCELKNRNTGYMLSEQKIGAISGVKCIEGSPMQYETDYVGADIESFTVEDELECQQECTNSNDCYYWTFDRATKICYLKENYGWTIFEKEVTISGAGL